MGKKGVKSGRCMMADAQHRATEWADRPSRLELPCGPPCEPSLCIATLRSAHLWPACQRARAAGQCLGSRLGRATWSCPVSTDMAISGAHTLCRSFPRGTPFSDRIQRGRRNWEGKGCKRPFVVGIARETSSRSRPIAVLWPDTRCMATIIFPLSVAGLLC